MIKWKKQEKDAITIESHCGRFQVRQFIRRHGNEWQARDKQTGRVGRMCARLRDAKDDAESLASAKPLIDVL